MRHSSAIALAGLTLALCGCTPMRWEHPQFGTAESQQALGECELTARQEAWRMAYSDPFAMAPRFYRGRDGRMYYDPYGRQPDPWRYEGQLQNYCMRAKGYQLVPAPQGSPTG